MDYGEATRVLERANQKFEFPVKWGVDLQSEHECYLTEKYAKKPVIVMNYPKDIKALKGLDNALQSSSAPRNSAADFIADWFCDFAVENV